MNRGNRMAIEARSQLASEVCIDRYPTLCRDRTAYEKDWVSSTVATQQMAVALYFIDVLALRAGHEKEEDEADTVGCCTLKVRS